MGKKGLGRKAFVKVAMAQPSGRGEEQETEEDSSPAQVAEDVTTAAEAEQPEQRTEAPQQPLSAADLSAAPPPPDAPGDETRGQALQRHKRVQYVLGRLGWLSSVSSPRDAHLTAGHPTRSLRRTRSWRSGWARRGRWSPAPEFVVGT